MTNADNMKKFFSKKIQAVVKEVGMSTVHMPRDGFDVLSVTVGNLVIHGKFTPYSADIQVGKDLHKCSYIDKTAFNKCLADVKAKAINASI